MKTDTEGGKTKEFVRMATPEETAKIKAYEEAKVDLETQQVIYEAKIEELSETIVGQKIASGESLTAGEIEEIAEEIPAPIPHGEDVNEEGGFTVGFTKPIAVPSTANKVRMVKLLLENNLIEASLISKETGQRIVGKPYFDEQAFIDRTEESSRRL